MEAARGADVVLLFLGEEASLSGEASSRAYLNLPGAQEDLAEEVAAGGQAVIAVIMAGRPLTFHDVAAKCGAVLYAWHPGTHGRSRPLRSADSRRRRRLPANWPSHSRAPWGRFPSTTTI